tara:strand:- start:240 stop:467 length:228 start_codon:yes stop_codon:yes gene_type:complete
MSRRNKILLFEEYCNISEGTQSDIKKYIKKNSKELDSLADDDEWDTIYQLLYTEFDVIPDSKKGKELRQVFDFIF